MGSGRNRRGGSGGFSVIRSAGLLAICAVALGGCADLQESFRKIEDRVQQTEFWPFASKRDGEGVQEVPAPRPKPADPRTTQEVALEPEVVTLVQGWLADLGYRPGPADGVMGRKTRDALRLYQDDNGLPVNGKITQATLGRLSAQAEAQAPKPQEAKPQTAKSQTGKSQSAKGEAAAAENAGSAAPAPDSAGAAASSAPLPRYEAGTRFVYADGEVRTVAAVEDGRIQWQSNSGDRFETTSNFLIPPLSWHTQSTSGARVVNVAPEELWPFRPGAQTEFTTTTTVRHDTRPDNLTQSRETWTCRVEESARVTVRAGTFDTHKVVCDGTSDQAGADSRHVWHYAPEIGHYVLYEEMDGSRRLLGRDELMAIQPDTSNWPPVARAGLGWALEHALETAAPGEETEWKSSAVETEVTIQPEGDQPQGKKQACRNFRQVWSGPDGERVYPGFACREPSGHWAVPGLDSGVAVAEKPG